MDTPPAGRRMLGGDGVAEDGECTLLRGGRVVADGLPSQVRDVLICRGVIVERRRHPAGHPTAIRDVSGLIVSPGLVDVHAHGACGYDFTTAEADGWRAALAAHLRSGTTSVLATLASDTPARLCAALGTAASLLDGSVPADNCVVPVLAGIHLEGPCLSPEQRGAHRLHDLLTPAAADELLHPVPAGLRLVTLAPELPGALGLIRRLAAAGVVVAAGHSSAGPEALSAAKDAGLTHLTHLWSGQSTVTRPALHRVPGLLEASLSSDDLTAEVIADGHHLPAELLRIALRCLGPSRLCLVSDATAGTGLLPGSTYPVGGATGVVRHGYGSTVDNSSLCGGTVSLAATLPVANALSGATTAEVLTMATRTPAVAAGLYPRRGSLRPGAAGDVVLLDEALRVIGVVARGEWVVGPPRQPAVARS